MANKPQALKQSDIKRALKAALDAGVKNPIVRITKADGTEIVIGGGGDVTDRQDTPESVKALI